MRNTTLRRIRLSTNDKLNSMSHDDDIDVIDLITLLANKEWESRQRKKAQRDRLSKQGNNQA